jgi:hypothetical protein
MQRVTPSPGVARRAEASSLDGAINAFTRVFDALWRHPGTMMQMLGRSRISLTLNAGYNLGQRLNS